MKRGSPILLTLAAAALAAPVNPEMLVSTEWLAAHAKDAKVVVIRVSQDRKEYDAGHIPGACFIQVGELMVPKNGVPNELPPAADLARVFERCGVTNDSRVVLYGDRLGLYAARAFFSLDYLGLGRRAALLDGGAEKWRAEKRPLSTEPPPARAGRIAPRIQPKAVIELAELQGVVAAPPPNVVILDTRPPADFQAGAIPGARHAFWRDQLESAEVPAVRPPEDLQKLYEAAGLTRDKSAIVYCGSGVQASFSYFTLRYLGYPVRLYDGSMSEWSRAAK